MRFVRLRGYPVVLCVWVDAYAMGGWLTEYYIDDYSYVVLPQEGVGE